MRLPYIHYQSVKDSAFHLRHREIKLFWPWGLMLILFLFKNQCLSVLKDKIYAVKKLIAVKLWFIHF